MFHLFLDCRKFSVRECDRDGDWVIALYQFEWGVNSFSVSSIVVCEFQSAKSVANLLGVTCNKWTNTL
jgi:hypothetical protein